MKKYNVYMQKLVEIQIEVEAEDEESAIDEAYEHSYLSGFVGNGGSGDKLIGTSAANVSLECEGEPLEGDYSFKITAEEINE